MATISHGKFVLNLTSQSGELPSVGGGRAWVSKIPVKFNGLLPEMQGDGKPDLYV
jgi:hypothetical protein